jgi:hypothetical protein
VWLLKILALQSRHRLLARYLVLGAAILALPSSGMAYEYEARGTVVQTIANPKVPVTRTTNEFAVCVRDQAWLILTAQNDGKGHSWQREVGTTNGTEIYESNGGQAFIYDTGIPVELLDKGVNGHLWLMLASRAYWTSLHSDQLTPAYDWQASVAANPSRKVSAKWDLLDGPGSLPREVTYFGLWGETNGLYRVTGTNSVGGMLFPSGFVFEESRVGPLNPDSFVHDMLVRKRVEVEVTSIQPVCSRKSLLPVRESGATVVTVDWRLKEATSRNNIPSYIVPDSETWPSAVEAKKLLEARKPRAVPGPRQLAQPRRLFVVGAVVSALALGPVSISLMRRLRRGTAGRR